MGKIVPGWLLCSLLFGFALHVNGADPAPGPSQFPSEILLQPQVSQEPLARRRYPLTRLNTPFAKEPAHGTQRVYRLTLKLDQTTNSAMAMIWDEQNRKLYLDLNRNFDFTDDPNAVYRDGGKSNRQGFTNVTVQPKAGDSKSLVLNYYLWLEPNGGINLEVALVSYWAAQLDWNEKAWQVGLIEDPFPQYQSGPRGPYLVLRHWTERTNLLSIYAPDLGIVSFPNLLFWEGQGFKMEYRWENRDGSYVPKLAFTPEQPALVDLKLSSQFLDTAVLSATNGYTVLLQEPGASLQIPKGVYRLVAVGLKSGDQRALRRLYEDKPVYATNGLRLTLGGPLTNSVNLYRTGKELRMDYALMGADGGRYVMRSTTPNPVAPAVSILRNGSQIHSANFQFG